jgi:hypothetical protein
VVQYQLRDCAPMCRPSPSKSRQSGASRDKWPLGICPRAPILGA